MVLRDVWAINNRFSSLLDHNQLAKLILHRLTVDLLRHVPCVKPELCINFLSTFSRLKEEVPRSFIQLSNLQFMSISIYAKPWWSDTMK